MLIVASKSIRSSPPRSGAAPASQARSRAAARVARTRARCGASIRSGSRSARSRLTSLAEVVPADLFIATTRSSPLGTAGAPRGGLIAAAGTEGRHGHQRSVNAPAAAPIVNPARTSDG